MIGKTTPKKIRGMLAPSILAASNNSFGTWASNPLVVAQAGGYKIAGDNANLTCDQNYATIRLTFKTTPDVTSTYIGWLLT